MLRWMMQIVSRTLKRRKCAKTCRKSPFWPPRGCKLRGQGGWPSGLLKEFKNWGSELHVGVYDVPTLTCGRIEFRCAKVPAALRFLKLRRALSIPMTRYKHGSIGTQVSVIVISSRSQVSVIVELSLSVLSYRFNELSSFRSSRNIDNMNKCR